MNWILHALGVGLIFGGSFLSAAPYFYKQILKGKAEPQRVARGSRILRPIGLAAMVLGLILLAATVIHH